jgi:hypothetical protein
MGFWLRRSAVEEGHDELFAAPPGEDVPLAEARFGGWREFGEQRITSQVPVLIVVGRVVIDVEHRNSEWFTAARQASSQTGEAASTPPTEQGRFSGPRRDLRP